MGRPQRLTTQTGRHSLVDGIPFQLPVASKESPALMAAFTVDAKVAQSLVPVTKCICCVGGAVRFC